MTYNVFGGMLNLAQSQSVVMKSELVYICRKTLLINSTVVLLDVIVVNITVSVLLNVAECKTMKKYCHRSIGICIGNTLLPKNCYWY